MLYVLSMVVVAFLVEVVHRQWRALAGDEDAVAQRRFWAWVGKGLVGALGVWVAWNSGLLFGLPPVVPDLVALPDVRSRLGALFRSSPAVLLLFGSYWAAVTLAWLVVEAATRLLGTVRRDFVASCILWSVFLGPVAVALCAWGGWFLAGLAVFLWLLPIGHAMAPLLAVKPPAPSYARAVGLMMSGKSDQAEWEVIRELEKCEEDFEGWMLLAQIYALEFRDLPAADRTVRELCDQPNVNPSQAAVALHRLADWHLKVDGDVVAASRALEEIRRRFPDTHLDKMARLRLERLPATPEEVRQWQRAKRIPLPATRRLDTEFEEAVAPDLRPLPPAAARALADQCVERLKADPNNVPEREKLARLLAEQLGELALGIEQLELLIALPDPPAGKTAAWLTLLAAWQLNHGHDREAARDTLERLLHECPRTPQAFDAQRRLQLMRAEDRFLKARRGASD